MRRLLISLSFIMAFGPAWAQSDDDVEVNDSTSTEWEGGTGGELNPYRRITITAKSYSRHYGDENPAFGYTVSGADLDGEPAIACEATALSPVGTYPIVITKGTVRNYNDHYVSGTLTVTPAPLTVSAGSYVIRQGDPLPTITPSYEGLKNGETDDVLTAKPSAICAAEPGSAPGTYPIVLTGGEAQNYSLTLVSGTLTILEPSAISTQSADEKPFSVHTIGGQLVRRQATSLMGLPHGIYMVKGRKVLW